MIFSLGQGLGIAILTLNIPHIAGFNITDIESGVKDFGSDFEKLENDVEDEVKSALQSSDGVLAQLTMAYQPYARTPNATAILLC